MISTSRFLHFRRPTRGCPARPILLALLLMLAAAGAAQAQGSADPLRSVLGGEPAGPAAAPGSADGSSTERIAQREAETSAIRRQIQQLYAEAESADAETERLDLALAQDPAPAFAAWRGVVEQETRADALEQSLRELLAEAQTLRSAILRDGQSLAALNAAEGSAEIVALRNRIAALENDTAAADEDDRASELEYLQATLELQEARLQTASVRHGLIEQRQRLAQRQLAAVEQRIAALQDVLGRRSETELQALQDELIAEAAVVEQQAPLLAGPATGNRELGDELRRSSERLQRLRQETGALFDERDRLQQSLRDTEARLSLGATSPAIGAALLAESRRLPLVESLRQQGEALREELAEVRLRLFDIADAQRDAERLRDAALQLALDEFGEDADPAHNEVALRETVNQLFQRRSGLLRQLEASLRARAAALEQAEAALHETLVDSQALRTLLERRLFWIRSNDPIGSDWFAAQAAGWHDLLKPARFAVTARLLREHLAADPWLPLLFAGVLLLLFWMRRHAVQRITSLAQPLRRVRDDRFIYTARAFALTVAAALPWALLAFFCGQLLQQVGEPGKYSYSLGRAVAGLAPSIVLLDFIRWMVIERGLAHAHLRWTRARRTALARSMPFAAAGLLPMQLLSSLAFLRGQELAIDTAGRSLLLLFCVGGALLAGWLLAPGRLWTPRGGVKEPAQLRKLLRGAVVALLLFTAVLVVMGFGHTASVLVRCLWQTAQLLLAVALFHGLLGRWFLLGERRLALRRIEQRQEQEALGEDRSSATGDAMPEVDADEIDIASVNAQTRRLLRALSATLLLVGLLMVWSDLLPALQRLDEIALWTFSDTAGDGSASVGSVTLQSLLLGLAILVLTFIGARNLPGLLEIGLLSRISLDAPTRYAISSLSRYAIVIAGVVAGLGLLGLRWSQLQWMAAALTVGLGFGLQEIFANFVSGIILLFERPFRVGDIITIGEFSGTVTKIRTRATTLLDFDNKEVVVPNKTFITDRLTNWTLTDSMTRLIVKVGVAYGSDVDRVHALLQQAATDSPFVLAEPTPRSWFIAFGASSLDFDLRVFVQSVDQRFSAMNDLNGRIAKLFSEAGVEIAFPQMDLHLRDVPREMQAQRDARPPGSDPQPPATPPTA